MLATPRRTLVIATTNRGKLVELTSLLADLPVDVRGIRELLPDPPTVVEDGETFRENALKKARAAASAARCLALADDSGLEVEALGGQPGVRSARFAGEDATDAQNIEALLAAIAVSRAASPLRARFRCVLAVAAPGADRDAAWTIEGICEGTIADRPRGRFGFGYDPIFVVAGMQRTMAELEPDEKNAVSHRARALARLRPLLVRLLERSPSE